MVEKLLSRPKYVNRDRNIFKLGLTKSYRFSVYDNVCWTNTLATKIVLLLLVIIN